MPEFRVDDYQGTDRERLGQAYAAAFAQMPSTVILPSRELVLSSYLNIRPGVSVRGEGPQSSVFLDYPGAAAPAGNSPYGFGVLGPLGSAGTRLEGFSIRGRGAGYYRLVRVQDTSDVTLSGLTFGVAGQNFIEVRGCSRVVVDGCVGSYGGDNSYDGASAKYKISVINSEDVELTRLRMGDPGHDRNQSFVTFNNVLRGSVRDSVFFGTRTYCLNTHGTGSRQIVFERNRLAPGAAAKFGAILLGNEAWGPDRDIEIRDNTMDGPGRFLEGRASTSQVIVASNKAPDCSEFIRVVEDGGALMVVPALREASEEWAC